jgi:diguanylate cyclase (GGDEF)-like protein
MTSYFPYSLADETVFVSTMPAGHRQRRLARLVVTTAAVLFLIGLPFSWIQLPYIWAFIPIYESWLVLLDLITAVLLFGQYAILRTRALLVLGSGYLFTATITVMHAISFPGLFTPAGLLGGGETTAWLYSFWKSGFVCFLLAYALLKDEKPQARGPMRRARVNVMAAALGVFMVVAALTLLATFGRNILPTLMDGDRYALFSRQISTVEWVPAVLVLWLLWRRCRSVLDLWVLVAACVTALEVALASSLNSGRFDLGWYLGRTYGLAAMSFVLLMLLLENNRLYARLADSRAELRRLAIIDPLTRVANRRAFDDALDEEWRRAVRNSTTMALLLIDVDRFKAFNDVHGHVTGDHCLRMVADTLAANVRRAGEMVARYGGEEFAILLPGSDLTKASELGRRLLVAVHMLDVTAGASKPHITISVGVASMSPAREADPVDPGATELVKAADRALYAAKAGGRNQVMEYLPHLEGLQRIADVGMDELPFGDPPKSDGNPT